MPYEYRKLSPKERREVVELRRQRGYPSHAPPHPFREAGYYLINAANFEHVPIMKSPERRTKFQSIMLATFENHQVGVVGWVILPNHYHVLVQVESLDLVSKAIQRVHGSTSHAWNMQDGLTGKRKVWCRFSDRMIRDEMHFYHALNYIHLNPEKHGYVLDVYAWEWSSFFTYVDGKENEWLQGKLRQFTPPNDFGLGWDDS